MPLRFFFLRCIVIHSLVVDCYFITHGITLTAHTQPAILAQSRLVPVYTVYECNVVFEHYFVNMEYGIWNMI